MNKSASQCNLQPTHIPFTRQPLTNIRVELKMLNQMEETSVGKSLTFKEDAHLRNRKSSRIHDDNDDDTPKRRRGEGCFSFMEIPIDPGVKSLKHLDSQKLKDGIKKWAKAVVCYARQVSQHFGSSRRSGSDEWSWDILLISGPTLCRMNIPVSHEG